MSRIKVDRKGTQRWYDSNGDLHNENGPAVLFKSGSYQYLVHGVMHREDGPALVYPGHADYFWHGKLVTEEEWKTQKFISIIEESMESIS